MDNTSNIISNITDYYMNVLAAGLILLVEEKIDVDQVCAGYVYYGIYCHPLAKFPGPFLAKFTNLYAAYHAFNQDLHLDILRCHRQYGKFVRYGPSRLLVDSPQALHDIYSHSRNVQKATAYIAMVPNGTGWTTMTAIDKNSHNVRRKLVSKMMSTDSLAIFETQLLKHLDTFCKSLAPSSVSSSSACWSAPHNIGDSSQHLTTKTISDFLFGRPIGDLQCQIVIDALRNYSWRMGVYLQCPTLAKLRVESITAMLGFGRRMRKEFGGWVQGYEQSALKNKGGRFRIFQDASVKNQDTDQEESAFTYDEIRAEGFFLTWAGSDATSTTISALLFYLAHNQTAYAQLATEIRSTFASGDQIISGPALNSCIFLAACVRETLRCCPSAPGAPWREVCIGGLAIDGEFLKAGLDVGTCIYSLQHREEYFLDPHRWVPERWLDQAGVWSMSKEASDAANSFSIGPRSCAGKSMAYLQINLVIARLLWEFDFKLPDGEDGIIDERGVNNRRGRERDTPVEYEIKAGVTSPSDGPILEFRRRDLNLDLVL